MSTPDPRAVDGWQPNYEPAIRQNLLTPGLCDRALEVAHGIGFEPSRVYNDELNLDPDVQRTETAENNNLRQSESAWILPEHAPDLYREIEKMIKELNKEHYRFAIYGMDPIQIIRYTPGSFFSDHSDIGNGPAAYRKLSVIVQLSDAADYKEGNVIVGQSAVPKERGAGCVFPSWTRHRVEHITEGTRYSLAAWGRGTWFN